MGYWNSKVGINAHDTWTNAVGRLGNGSSAVGRLGNGSSAVGRLGNTNMKTKTVGIY